jgi:hypothetical protein
LAQSLTEFTVKAVKLLMVKVVLRPGPIRHRDKVRRGVIVRNRGWIPVFSGTHRRRRAIRRPLFLVPARTLFRIGFAHLFHELDQRQKQGNHDAPDDHRQENNHDRFQ